MVKFLQIDRQQLEKTRPMNRATRRSPRPLPTSSAVPNLVARNGSQEQTESAQPRYLQIAHELTSAIAGGTYPVGAQLPTEHQLCEQFGISRSTAREAVRTLVAGGLVTRRPRVGTVVTATADAPRYTHGATTIPDLLQYASDTELRLVYIGKVALGKAQSVDFGVPSGQEWVYALGIRVASATQDQAAAVAPPICVTRLYLNPLLEGIETRLRGRRGAVQALIESEYGIPIDRVEQELHGMQLDAEDALNLGTEVGAAGLRITRRYFDRKGVLLEYADNVHAADRFVYRMQLKR
jgi:GntR family transcriptional regulator